MRIVPQSASNGYGPLLALPAPKIAGLLPARVGSQQSTPPSVFTYAHPQLDELPAAQRDSLFEAMTTLFGVATGHALGHLNDQALNAALTLVRRAVTGERMRPSNPARYAAEADADMLDWLVGTSRRMAVIEQQVTREVDAIRQEMAFGSEGRP